ncbi:hypothetical protein ACTQ49_08135 [Luteococcus sp. Sow4_B9]|uniref:hypothetical protein n=1 Tax=Luteococcus sp. Sow4_B9 TaxID=3438792 RepID=UPI003F9741F6
MRRHDTPASSGTPRWFFPALMALLGVIPVVLSWRQECMSLPGGETADQVCTSGAPAGAWIFAVICWFCAWFLWVAQKRS